ncbi:MMPL family transporter [Mycolicibacterium holsaticum]|uniref:MMPL family transporter n=1 Tax=Mycolicibacterium holsaticum TaxID=152142 RepID=UPI001C7CF32E|nr:MMPL family transporter [Mycolicibacterium holsaticum]MDA4110228.1 membrane protein [Mycolicibacterium holsaticum DSM 44478 = JCM 12374]QZA11872.1 MMPL family transporter [Mycolicibacterium holsaticum DSM 44478 = JCM 12374]UNC10640.1 MMPL family transporter [Mycolicibacterium holsaticum DSM 44478 = JCM 12374]
MLHGIARLAIVAPRRVIAVAALITVLAALFGIPVANRLCACGFQDPTSESTRATQLLTEKFDHGDVQLLIVVTAPDGATSASARHAGIDIVDQLHRSAHVATVTSAWTAPPPTDAQFISKDGRSGLIIAGIRGGENDAQQYAKMLAEQVAHDRDGVTIRAGGVAMVNVQITEQSQRDVLLMEMIAIPLSFLVLVWVFGGLLVAAVPIAVGVTAILGALAVLHLITFATDVSIFALNLTAAMGLALAIDYTLLMVSRFRDELTEGAGRDDALIRTMVTAGRTVVFSATTVALSVAAMVLFPMPFLRSFAYAGVATVGLTMLAALVVTPAAIVLLGDRLNAHRKVPRPVEHQFWYRAPKFVMSHAIPIGLTILALLLLLGVPFFGVRWGFPDDRVLPPSASSHQAGDQLRNDFATNFESAVTVVMPDAADVDAGEMRRYAADLARVPDVAAVSPPTVAEGSAFFTVESTAPLFTERSEAQLDGVHAVKGPAGKPVLITGTAQINRDSVAAITTRLPLVLGVIAVIMLGLLFLLTGSAVVPLKALAFNVLSLTAAFGAMVWIFQDGHLDALGTTPTGTLTANIAVLLFCVAFGLSMDYEVFLVSRIREFWLASGAAEPATSAWVRTSADNDESVALGVARTARVITAAALIMSISFAALIAANVSVLRLLGLGLTLAVLADATLVRMVLVPAFMHLLGRWNWWAPKWMSRLHNRFGLDDGDGTLNRPDPEVVSST